MRTMRGYWFAAALLGVGWSLTGCGSDGGNDGSQDGGPPVEDAGRDAGLGTWIGPEGGVVTSADGHATLTLPAGAVDEAMRVTLAPADPDALPPAEGVMPGRAYDLGPDGATFLAPVELAVRYEPGEVPADRDEAELRLHVLEDDVEWVEVPGSAVDVGAREVTASLEHFTVFGPGARILQVPWPGFDATFVLDIDVDVTSCSGPVPTLGPRVRVTVTEGQVSFGFGTGTYELGRGVGSHEMSLPINPVSGCVAHVDSRWTIRFTSLRRFVGTLDADITYTEGCETDPCAFTWQLEATRPR